MPPKKSKSSDEKEKTEKKPKTKPSAKKSKAPAKVKGPDPFKGDQKQEYNDLLKSLMEKSIDDLKKILELNDQSKTGTKKALVEKVADGMVFGKIPRCIKCGGGRPRPDHSAGTYKCPGYMDDDVFKNCHHTYTWDELSREKWTSP